MIKVINCCSPTIRYVEVACSKYNYFLFTYPQLVLSKGEAERKLASALLTFSISQGENIAVVIFLVIFQNKLLSSS